MIQIPPHVEALSLALLDFASAEKGAPQTIDNLTVFDDNGTVRITFDCCPDDQTAIPFAAASATSFE